METQTERRRPRFLDQDFKPSLNHIVESREVLVRTLQVQRLLHSCFFRNQISLYQVQVIIPNLAAQDRWQKLEQAVIVMLDKLHEEVRGERERLKVIADQAQIPVESSGVFAQTEPMETVLSVFSPEANRFLDLLLALDGVIDIANRLWIRGRFSTQQQRALATQWRRKLVRFTRELHLTRIRAARAAKSERAEKMRAREQASHRTEGPVAAAAETAESNIDTAATAGGNAPEVANVVEVAAAPRSRRRVVAARSEGAPDADVPLAAAG